MSPKSVWNDFIHAGVVTKKAKHGSGEESYDTWTCPHCGELLEALKSDVNRKGPTCTNHLWKAKVPCAKRPKTDLRGQPKPPTASTTTTVMPEAPVAATPVIGEPVNTNDDTLRALNEELIAVKILAQAKTAEAEANRAEAEACRAEKERSEIELNRERILSERRKRERSESYEDAGVPSPHSSDGEEERAKKRRAFKKVVTRVPPAAAASTPPPPAQPPRTRTPTLQQHLEEQRRAQDAMEEETHASRAATTAVPPVTDKFRQHFSYVLKRSAWATDKTFKAFHDDKFIEPATKKSAKVVMDVITECKNKREAKGARKAKR